MLSAFPPTLPFDSLLANPFPPFEPCFPTWESNETLVLPHPPSSQEEQLVCSPQPSREPFSSNCGSDTSNPDHVTLNCALDDPNRNEPGRINTKTLRSASGEADRLGSVADERKRRRMLSNRESARRSRMRKQKHLENLRNQVSRLKEVKWGLVNRLRLVLRQTQLVDSENEFLRSEAVCLRRRLCHIRQVLIGRQHQQHLNPTAIAAWPCSNIETLPLH